MAYSCVPGYLRDVQCSKLLVSEVQLWLLAKFFMAGKQKIKNTRAVIVLEGGSTLTTSCVCFGCSWWGSCV